MIEGILLVFFHSDENTLFVYFLTNIEENESNLAFMSPAHILPFV